MNSKKNLKRKKKIYACLHDNEIVDQLRERRTMEKTDYVQVTSIRLWLLFQEELKTVKYLQVLKQRTIKLDLYI